MILFSDDFLINSSADVHVCVKQSHCSFPSWIHRIFARFTGIPLACIILEKCFLMWQKSEFRSWTVYFGKSDDLHCQAPAFRLTLSINRLKSSSRNLAGHHSQSVLSLKTRFKVKGSEMAFSHWALCLWIAVIDGAYIWPPHQDFPYHILKHLSLLIIRLKYVFSPSLTYIKIYYQLLGSWCEFQVWISSNVTLCLFLFTSETCDKHSWGGVWVIY